MKPAQVRGQFIFSPIFESEEECKNNPFVLEKFDLKTRSPANYPDLIMAGILLRLKKKKLVNF